MDLIVEREEVWAARFMDRPGGLATILTGLREAGADLRFIISRRAPEKPGTGVVFVTPLKGDTQIAAAAILGFSVTTGFQAVRVEGENRRGLAVELTEMLAAAGIDLHGLSASVAGDRFLIYFGFNTVGDARTAVDLLRAVTLTGAGLLLKEEGV